MPKEIAEIEKLDEIIPKTLEVRVKKVKDIVKVKFRTRRYLYTIKLTDKEAEALINELKKLDKKIIYFD
ncbi:MAG: 50S ribosomal protein L38e [Candidatus Njordarchaeia archaeon]